MKKMESRAFICLVLAFILIAGMLIYVVKLGRHGSEWASYPANQDVYKNGYLSTGSILDRNGEMLLEHTSSGETKYNSDYYVRRATVHATGDAQGNISSGANQVFASSMVGYNFITGTFTTNNKGRNVYLTIDKDVCATAAEALGERNGTIGVYNYKTGEIVCMVSAPNYDPLDPPSEASEGVYLNKFLSSTVVPGSTLKVLTSMAAIENINDLDDWTYECNGSEQYGSYKNDRVKCTYAHGTVDFKSALAQSCNCAFGKLTTEIGASKMKKYAEQSGLLSSYDVDGVQTEKSVLKFPSGGVSLAWAGIGQYKDQVNPCSLMVFMGAIANGGKTANPKILNSIRYSNGFKSSIQLGKDQTSELIDSDTADELDKMLHNDVTSNYGEYNFPGLDLCAKSGTAEIGDYVDPHSWFTGYIRNKEYPYAFVVLVENGGWGSEVAGSVANTVMQKVVETESLAYED